MARGRFHDFFEKGQYQFDRLLIIERRETGGKKAGHGFCFPERDELVFFSMPQEKDLFEASLFRRSDLGLSMPGCSVHPYSLILSSEDDPIVTQNLNPARPLVKLRHSCLTRSRLAHKEMGLARRSDNSTGMDLHALPCREKMSDREFV